MAKLSARLLFRSIFVSTKASLKGLLAVLGHGIKRGEDVLELFICNDGNAGLAAGVAGDYDSNISDLVASLLRFLPNLRILVLDLYQDFADALAPDSPVCNAVSTLKRLRRLYYPSGSMPNSPRIRRTSFPST